MKKLAIALLPLLLALPLEAQPLAIHQLQQVLDSSQTSNPGAAFEGSLIRRPSAVVVPVSSEEALREPVLEDAPPARKISGETRRASRSLKSAAGTGGSFKGGPPEVEDCDGFFSCMGAALIAPFVRPVVLGMAWASAGIMIGDEKAGTFGMIAGGIIGGLYGFGRGIISGLGALITGTFKAFKSLFKRRK